MTSAPPPPGSRTIDHTPAGTRHRGRSSVVEATDRPQLVAVLGMRANVRVSGGPSRRVAAIAAMQRGHVCRAQLLAAGLSSTQIGDMLKRGQLFAVHAGVYAVGHPGPVPHGAETAALLACPAGTLLSHESAAALWSMPGLAAPRFVEVLVSSETRVRRPGIEVHRSRAFDEIRPAMRHGLPVTSAAQTLLDLALTLPRADHARAVHAALDDRIVRREECLRLLGVLPTHPGAPQLRVLITDPDAALTESELERRFATLVRDADLPPHQRQVRTHGYRLDFYWPHARLAVETDGFGVHGRQRRRFERDRERDARLAALGIEVMRVTWRQVVDEPLAVIARLAATIARRTELLGR